MIEIYKMVHGEYDRNAGSILRMYSDVVDNPPETRRHSLRLYFPTPKKDVKKKAFTWRTAEVWNGLPKKVVTSETVNAFKNGIDKFWEGEDFMYDFTAQYNKYRRATTLSAEATDGSDGDQARDPTER